MKFKRVEYKETPFHFFENEKLILGYSEIDAELEHIEEYFIAEKTIQLDQVHGNKIFFTDEVKGYPEGDGLIFSDKNVMAVIRTADCVPLFFWTKDNQQAGIIHVGWRGLHSKIGLNLLNILKQKGSDTNDLLFFTGPAIEGKCYIVQQDVVDKFRDFSFSDKIFKKTSEGYDMDVVKGIELCLIEQGIPKVNITHSGICTFCNKYFPSYRRGDREKRIFNFILIK